MSGIWVWLDLEMTGLGLDDEILEVACILTDHKLNEIGEEFSQVVRATEEKLEAMEPVCVDMHKQSGLWGDVLQATRTIEEVEENLINFVVNQTSAHDQLILCGNSIHVDREFIKRYMVSFNRLLHYRMLDVTAVGMCVQASFADFSPYTKEKSHRALDDIRESIGELSYYMNMIKND